MKSAELGKLARFHGISPTRPSPDNRDLAISAATKRKILSALNKAAGVIEVERAVSFVIVVRSDLPHQGKSIAEERIAS